MSEVPNSSESFLAPQGPLLTPSQIDALDEPGYGVTQPNGIPRYATFEAWQESGGLKTKDNFCFNFSTIPLAEAIRQAEHFERFKIVHKNQFDVLQVEADELGNTLDNTDSIEVDVDYLFWNSYEKLADLVDANDRHVRTVANFEESADAQRYLTR